MAFLRVRVRPALREGGERRYYYIVENRRRSGTVRQKTLEYLGRDPDPKRLKSALVYWGVKKRKP